ncbi:MAG: Mrp/NBP35 family ATP-binding protein [Chloroflexota bacterium]
MVTREKALEALRGVIDPELRRNIVELGMVKDLSVDGNRAVFTLALTTPGCPLRERMRGEAETALLALDGIHEVDIRFGELSPQEKARIMPTSPAQKEGAAEQLNNIDRVIAVMSGKGGVGKSLVSGLLAVALRRKGLRVGVLDADITGPSIPRMFFPTHRHPQSGPVGILPVESETGIKIMSINLLLPAEDEAVIWRGPLISGAIKQFWGDVLWGDLDYLIVDLPPGTSDASLTVMQSLPLNGVVLVTSPQGLADMVVAKAARMAERLSVPLLGLIENMSYVVCPDTGKHLEVFGPSKSTVIAARFGIPLLGRLPIDPEVAQLCDVGRVEELAAQEFTQIAEQLVANVPAAKPPLMMPTDSTQ